MLPERWRAALPVVAAVAVVAALSLLTVTVMSSVGSDDDDLALVDADASTTTTTQAARRIAPRPTTTTTRPDPEVLGETVARDPDAAEATNDPTPTTSPAPATAPAPATTAGPSGAPAGAAPTPSTAPPAPTTTAPAAPPTTTCRNSTDPSCGELSWTPEPGPYEVEVYAVATPVAARAGEPVTFAIDYVDPSGTDALGACINWSAPAATVDVSTCEEIATSCERTGPHDTPEPSRDRIRVERSFTFDHPGTYEVTVGGNVATHLADECPSPYRNTMARRSFTIEVS